MSDSISRITSMLETARDLTLEAAAVASAKLAETPNHLRPKEVSQLLNSRSERDILKGLKYVISLISRGEDASGYFTDIVKNVTSSSLKIRKLVYTYILRYADKENDLALLSINAIQKSLGDKSEQVRALAIRVISEINIPSIYPIVLLGIKKCSSDQSACVRKAAAVSLVKVYNNHSKQDDLLENIKLLLKDKDVEVLSSAILAFKVICPEKLDFLHGHFRRLCSLINTLDEWAQTYTVELLTNYARLFLPKPTLFNSASNENESIQLPDNYNEIPFPVYDIEYDSDLELFLNSIKNLSYSRNEAVILAVSRAFFHLAPPKVFKEAQIAAPLVRTLLTSRLEVQNFILQSILYMSIHDPTLFVQYEKRFYVLPNDSFTNVQYKLKILAVICNENNIKSITQELQYYTLHYGSQVAVESVKALGVCSQTGHYWSAKTLKWLLQEITNIDDGNITTEFLTVIRYLVQQNPTSNIRTVAKLAKLLDEKALAEGAKESIVWLVGEFSGIEPKIGPDVVRKLLKGFAYEKPNVRYQTIMLASKIYSYHIEKYKEESGDIELLSYDYDNTISRIFSHSINLGRYDDVYDIRDRSRMLFSLLNSKHTQLATLLLQAPKPVPLVSLKKADPLESSDYLSTLPVDEIIKQYNTLPSWSDPSKLPESSIRDRVEVKNAINSFSYKFPIATNTRASNGSSIPAIKEKKYKLQSLDDFFAEENLPSQRVKKKIVYKEELESSSEEESSSAESSDEEVDSEEDQEHEEEEEEDEIEEDENSHVRRPLL